YANGRPVGRTEKKSDDKLGHRDTKTQRTTRCRERARRGAAQRRARRANRKRTTTGGWLGRSFAVGAPHGAACGAGRPRRAPLCLGVSVACPNQYVAVITRFCTYREQRLSQAELCYETAGIPPTRGAAGNVLATVGVRQ